MSDSELDSITQALDGLWGALEAAKDLLNDHGDGADGRLWNMQLGLDKAEKEIRYLLDKTA